MYLSNQQKKVQPINALSLTPAVNDWLKNARYARILHVFDRACNLINQRGEVLSIVTPQIGAGPFNLVIEEDVFFSDHLEVQSPISIRTDQLHLGDLTIYASNAQIWSPCPDWGMLHAERDSILDLLASHPITDYLKQSDFPGPATPLRLPSEQGVRDSRTKDAPLDSRSGLLSHQELSITNNQFSNSLLYALINADLPSCLTAAQKLAGLGIGLTPAGDDFILGAVLAVRIIHPPEVARVLAVKISQAAAPLTTSLSSAWLRSAGKGEAGILWHAFFDALILNDKAAVQESLNQLLGVGATSGSDALGGFICTLLRWAEMASSKIP